MRATQVRQAEQGVGFEFFEVAADDADEALAVPTLPEGTCIKDYEIVSVLGRSAIGIFYLARDATSQFVAIKEYLPEGLATREPSSLKVVASPQAWPTFKIGRRLFLDEARLLDKIDAPAVARVVDAFEHLGTAYAVLPHAFAAPPMYSVQSLAQAVVDLGRNLTESELLRVVLPVLDGLSALHAAGFVHRNIRPETIVLFEGHPLLLPFTERKDTLFAPLEQCVTGSTLKVGPWTDIYSLAAVMYAALTGSAPIPATQRLAGISLPPPVTQGERLSERFIAAIASGLELRSEARPQSAQAFRALLAPPDAAEKVLKAAVVKPVRKGAIAGMRLPAVWTGALVAVLLAVASLVALTHRQNQSKDARPALALDGPATRSGQGKVTHVEVEVASIAEPMHSTPEPAANTVAAEVPSQPSVRNALAPSRESNAREQPEVAPLAAVIPKTAAKRKPESNAMQVASVSPPVAVAPAPAKPDSPLMKLHPARNVDPIQPSLRSERTVVPLVGYP